MLSYLAGALAELGEFRELDSIAGASVRRFQGLYGPDGVPGPIAAIFGNNKLRKGDLDSAALWLRVAAADTSPAGRDANAAWLPSAEGLLLVQQGRFHGARDAVARIIPDTRTRRSTRALLTALIRRGEGDSVGAWGVLDSALTADITLPRPAPYLVYALLTAAEWRYSEGRLAAADSLARLALAASSLDSLALIRSAHVGRAELIRAQVAAAGGQTAAAREAAQRSLRALANGYGTAHPAAQAARSLLASLGP